ncbi:ERF family protein [Vampirovibrio chlorellavorus]|uniref:ERF family protein n=1 Tax=Vampirovibrio chlorellavorus TaxID=758823 RepID=UPI0026F121AC|nr:ERF family protein [Vampirovibrio chlorellavorus]
MSGNTAKTKPHGLYAKILTVQKAIESVPKRGFNAFHKYHYATEADILTVKQILNTHGLMVLPTTLDQSTGTKADGKNWASVTLLFRVVDAETGEAIDSQFTGYAEDTFDKAIYKATTGANKYFYLKFFGIATEDDPEREDSQPVGSALKSQVATPRAIPEGKGRPSYERRVTAATGAREPLSEKLSDGLDGTLKEEASAVRSQALNKANQILALQREHHLSNDEVLQWAEISSIKALAEAGRLEELETAYQKLLLRLASLSTP